MERITCRLRRAIHGQFERKSGEALDFFGGVAGPLRDELDHGRRKIGISVDGHARKETAPAITIKDRDHQHEEALAQGELDDVMDHRGIVSSLRDVSMSLRLPSAATNS